MENKLSHEHRPAKVEVPPTTVDQLAEWLGFKESEELRKIRELVLDASTLGDREKVGDLVTEYQLRGELLLNNLRGGEYARGQIGLIVARATLSRDMGNLESFLYHIEGAKEYAVQQQEGDTVAALEKAPSVEIARILFSIGEGYGFDEETIAAIAAMPYGQAFEVAYGYLLQAGLDVDDILAAFIEHNLEVGGDSE